MSHLSNRKINAAGDAVREYLLGEEDVEVSFDALQVIRAFRADHATPLQRVAVNLRYYVDLHSLSRPIVVGQRLKRLTTIADKLCRQPKMQLSRMHDVGGCRAVVNSEAEIREIVTHVRRRWDCVRFYDYIAEPKPHSGYRAYHLVVAKDGRLVEVQLRTATQHRWAELIEIVDRRNPDIDLKGGSAPADLVEYYRLGSELLAADERGEPAEAAAVARFRELHQQVAGYHGPNR
ncbi:MAG TPA: hypothetical protein VMY78_13455 [Solirubrobacteraceae bacterium]|nr:hypothetical protein [Solirubrobacteraceae bacterium]